MAPPPPRIGRFELRGTLGQGGFASVARAYDPQLDREVALKLIRSGDAGGDPRRRARFEREAEALSRLSHPGVVRVHEVGQHEGQPFLVMDLIEGPGDLQRRLDEQGPLPVGEALALVAQLAEAVEAAHQAGVLHRDLKPANVLVDRGGRACLSDFGLARLLQGSGEESPLSLTEAGQMLGTPGFWAPEQLRGKKDRIGVATDVHGLGSTLYALLTGGPPRSGPVRRIRARYEQTHAAFLAKHAAERAR